MCVDATFDILFPGVASLIMLFLLFLAVKTALTLPATKSTLRMPQPQLAPIFTNSVCLLAAPGTRHSHIAVMPFKHFAVLEIFVANRALFPVIIG
jgi:hypothetical protein